MSDLAYAIVGGPPADWKDLVITDLASGAEIADVFEVNADEGWLTRFLRNDQGHFYLDETGEKAALERLEGAFSISRRT